MYSNIVKIHPYVGNNYNNTKPKILILGLSVYDKEGISETTAQSYINGLINKEWNYAFFTKIQNTFCNEKHWDKISYKNYSLNVDLFWNDFCFYEYIQDKMNHPKEKTPEVYWENAKEPFIEVLKELKPDIVIALGYETYDNLPEFGEGSITIKYKENVMYTWKYNVDNKDIYVCRVQHPSSFGFNQEIWGKLFQKFIKKYESII